MSIPNNEDFRNNLVPNLSMSSSSEATSSYICARHLEEWVKGSGVSEQITRLNVKTLEDNEEIAQHLGWKKYKHTAGWWCSGINPRNGLPIVLLFHL